MEKDRTAPETQAPDNIETSFDAFKALADSITAATPTDAIEGIIKPILTNVLEWQSEELTPCKTVTPPHRCIRLCIDGGSRAAVIIQDESLGLTGRNADRPYRLDGPVLATPEATNAIRQACMVCGMKNCELAIITTGSEWIIFRGNRLGDGKDTLEGLAFAFPDMEAVKQHFKLFYDLLARGPVTELRYRAHFQEAEGQPIRSRSFGKVLRMPHSLRPLDRGKLAADLDRVMDSFFKRLVGDKDPEMLLKCFVVTKESAIAEDKIARISEELVGRIKTLDTRTSDTLGELIHKVQVTHNNEFVLLVGTKGAGKSTFIERFFDSVLDSGIRDECVRVYVDMKKCSGSEHRVIEWLNDTLLEKMERAIYADSDPDYNELLGMFFDEYCRWSKGPYKHLYESDESQFKIEFGRHLERKRVEKPHDYICRLMRHIVNNRKKAPCLIFDNADHFPIEFQERVYQYAQSLFESTTCLVIMPITDKTSWQLSRQGAMQSFESVTSLFLPTPLAKTVLEQRIKYLERKSADEDEERGRGYFLGQGIHLELTQLKAFARCLQQVFIETGRASRWVGSLSNHDIRRSLELTRSIMASPYIKVDELLTLYITKDAAAIPEYDIQRAIIRGNYNFYPVDSNQFVQNIYSLRTEIGTSPLLGLRILQALFDAHHREVQGTESFVAVAQIFDYFQATTIERRAVSLWLDAMLKTGLCLSYDPTHTGIEQVQKVEISPAGRQHLLWGASDENYIGSMMEVTPINDPATYDTIKNAPRDNKTIEWVMKTVAFTQYLLDEDKSYVQIPDHESYQGQHRLTNLLEGAKQRIDRKRESILRQNEAYHRQRRNNQRKSH